MKRVYEANIHNSIVGWDRVENGEQFIYVDVSGAEQFFGIKITDDWGAFINADGKFFLVKLFKNCLSSYDSEKFMPYSINYSTYEEAKAAAEER